MTMFTAKPKFNLAEFLAEPAPAGGARNRSRSGSKMWQSKPAAEEDATAPSEEAKRATKAKKSDDT